MSIVLSVAKGSGEEGNYPFHIQQEEINVFLGCYPRIAIRQMQ